MKAIYNLIMYYPVECFLPSKIKVQIHKYISEQQRSITMKTTMISLAILTLNNANI